LQVESSEPRCQGAVREHRSDLHNTLCPKFLAFAAETAQRIIEGL